MKKVLLLTVLGTTLLSSCVSKKKYTALESDLNDTRSMLTKTQVEKEDLATKMAKIEARVADYNEKINSLKDINDRQFNSVNDVAIMSNNTKERMRNTLSKVDPTLLMNATTLEDSINVAISYNLKKSIADDEDDVHINIDKTVVMITISDKLLFTSGSYTLNNKANSIL